MKFRRIKAKVHILTRQEAIAEGLVRSALEKSGVHFTIAVKGKFQGHYVRVKTGKRCCESEKPSHYVKCTRPQGHKGFHRADDCWGGKWGWDEGSEPWK